MSPSLLASSVALSTSHLYEGMKLMVTITFPDRKTEKRALAFLLGRFSGRVLRSGEHLVPEAASRSSCRSEYSIHGKGKGNL